MKLYVLERLPDNGSQWERNDSMVIAAKSPTQAIAIAEKADGSGPNIINPQSKYKAKMIGQCTLPIKRPKILIINNSGA